MEDGCQFACDLAILLGFWHGDMCRLTLDGCGASDLFPFGPFFLLTFHFGFMLCVCVFVVGVVDVVCDVCAVCAVACLVHFTTDMSDEQQSGPDRMGLSSCGTWTRWVLK